MITGRTEVRQAPRLRADIRVAAEVVQLLLQPQVLGIDLRDLRLDGGRPLADLPVRVHLPAELDCQQHADDHQDQQPCHPAAGCRKTHARPKRRGSRSVGRDVDPGHRAQV